MGSVRVFYPRLDREQVVAALRERLPRLAQELELALVVLFGSYAHGNYTVASDVDLLVVYRGPERPDAFALVKRLLALPGLEPHVYPEADYQALRPTLEAMTRDGIVLWGRRG
ncbi:MAG TPA: nucleotidyltransferase domain-containing protein [Dehalococcoidia bacterium]|nr:nucleotidyltransferase domain-containing protein [Dehalococcoidia bacterium]